MAIPQPLWQPLPVLKTTLMAKILFKILEFLMVISPPNTRISHISNCLLPVVL